MKKYFGVMLDMSRNAVMKPIEVINYAKILKSFGYNMIQLYTEDTYEVDDEPYFGYMRGRYTQEDLSYIVSECEKIGVELIPCIQTLAHMNQALRWDKIYGEITDVGDILLAGEDRTYELIENMFKSLRKSFTSEYVHIGMDEAEMIGRGKYFNKHGYRNHLEILNEHLLKVIEIAKRYKFKPIMWSDMFFKLATGGAYYDINANVTEEIKKSVPEEVELVYWDYYHDDKETYDGMFSAHKKFNNEIWFAGGAWTWGGFTPANYLSMRRMFPAMQSAREHGVENVLMTCWGDNGKECSFYSILPSLYAIKRQYDGETDMNTIKAEFEQITGEKFDTMIALDLPNCVAGNTLEEGNVSKYALYSDPFNGFLDCACCKEGVNEEYKAHAQTLETLGKSSQYGYLFETASALCNVLELKYDLGVRTRETYQSGNKTHLKALIGDYEEIGKRLDVFYTKFRMSWYKENHPSGFDVHDIRLGGLKQRLISCRERLEEYLAGKIECIPELEEKVLPYFEDKEKTYFHAWKLIASANRI